MKEKVLIIPRNDGMAVSAGGKVYIVEMSGEPVRGSTAVASTEQLGGFLAISIYICNYFIQRKS